MSLAAGTYRAKPTGARVYENDKGNLIVCVAVQIEDGPELKAFSVIVDAAGVVKEKNVASLREWSGWDGQDPFWFTTADLTAIDVEVVTELQPGFNDATKMYASVKWINAPGRGAAPMKDSDDRRAILAKFGSQLRANAGGTPVKPAGAKAPVKAPVTKPATKAPAGTPPPPMGTPPPGLPPPVLEEPSTMEACWTALLKARPGIDQAGAQTAWYGVLASTFPGIVQTDLTPAQWGKIMASIISDDLPF